MKFEFNFVFFGHSSQHAVKYVVIALINSLGDNTRLFQQILINLGTFNDSIFVKMNINILSKPTRVIVSDGLCISKS